MASTVKKMCDSSDSKKRKIEDSPPDSKSFKGFSIERVLREDQRTKFVCLEGKFKGNEDLAVVLLEKEHFPTQSLGRLLSNETTLKETLKNDIYSTYEATPPTDLSGFKTTLIYPATQKHVDKYSEQDHYIIRETPALYEKITLPCLESSNFSMKWVYNILDKKSEADRIVMEDPDPDSGFVLLPDMKWDGKDVDSLYLIAIVHRHGIKSLRDLGQQHLPLLKNILEKGTNTIQEKYSVAKSQLRVYFHYQPSYYHLHVHFTHLRFEAPGFDALRAHLLEDVIDNIETCNDFYQNKSLMFTVRENQQLYKDYKENGYFK
ncbi:m7GpppX diphosphatase-like [Haliotis cracherodii]|uniref:m7GpppX diphosphatase-like n=1 Tax=Haliotis cracherodii TaxID=6455 RepID=UPI0039E9B0C6